MFYLNGDNDLTHEVLYAVDMLETVGSSENINILALVDGRPGGHHGYGDRWSGSKLLYITRDNHIGKIKSPVLADMGEQDLGNPETLESFIKKCLAYSAQRYIFCTFAHGRGIIDTKTLTPPGAHKTLAISVDETDGSQMTFQEFRRAVRNGLNGNKFDAMVLFSCLTNMVEVGYALKDLTDYLIGSEDEIRIVNTPPGSFQIRGIKFEESLKAVNRNPSLSINEFGKITIDTFIEQYTHEINLTNENGQSYGYNYPASMALIACGAFDQLAIYLDRFAQYICSKLELKEGASLLLGDLHSALSETQRYPSFLNLEYYDVLDFFRNLAARTQDRRLKRLCRHIAEFMLTQVIVYERHTNDCASNGISIFISNYTIPQNIFESHQKMYRRSAFSRDTSWDEMIEAIRRAMISGRYSDRK